MIKLNDIILGDCMDVMKDIPDKHFEFAIVDPPYGIKDFIVMGGESNKKIKFVVLSKYLIKLFAPHIILFLLILSSSLK